MNIPATILLAWLLAVPACAQFEECPTLPQEGEGYYPAYAPPFDVDTTNGGWNAQPPRFMPLGWADADMCGSFFRYQDASGVIRRDEDWFERIAFDLPIWLLQVWTQDDHPVHYQLTDESGYLQDCGILYSGMPVSLYVWSGAYELGLSLGDEAPLGQEIPWRMAFVTAGSWDPVSPPNETPAGAEPVSLPFETVVDYAGSLCNLVPADLDPAHLWQTWQGPYDPLRTALAGDVWYRFSLPAPQMVQASFTCGHQGDLLVFRNDGGSLGDLLLGGSTSCNNTLSLAALYPPGDYFVAVAGTEATGMGLLRIEALACAPPDLQIARNGTTIELAWAAVPDATAYRVLAGDTPSSLVEIALVTTPAFVETQALAHVQRFYQVVAICE